MSEQVMAIKKVILPLKEAIQKAAEQNVKRDHRIRGAKAEKFEDLEPDAKQAYLNEARGLMRDYGENYTPVYPDTEHFCVQQNESK